MKKFIKIIMAIAIVGILSACSSQMYHNNFMRGQIVKEEGNQVVLCIGHEDGAETGMMLDVYTIIYEGTIMEGTDNYERNLVGTVAITEVIDGHFARAKVTSGTVQLNDVVEITKK